MSGEKIEEFMCLERSKKCVVLERLNKIYKPERKKKKSSYCFIFIFAIHYHLFPN